MENKDLMDENRELKNRIALLEDKVEELKNKCAEYEAEVKTRDSVIDGAADILCRFISSKDTHDYKYRVLPLYDTVDPYVKRNIKKAMKENK